jgi:hypothetical protein
MKITLGRLCRLPGLESRAAVVVASEGKADPNAGTTHEAARDFTKSLRRNGIVFMLLKDGSVKANGKRNRIELQMTQRGATIPQFES